jgi:hypothetical protein
MSLIARSPSSLKNSSVCAMSRAMLSKTWQELSTLTSAPAPSLLSLPNPLIYPFSSVGNFKFLLVLTISFCITEDLDGTYSNKDADLQAVFSFFTFFGMFDQGQLKFEPPGRCKASVTTDHRTLECVVRSPPSPHIPYCHHSHTPTPIYLQHPYSLVFRCAHILTN